MVEKVERKTVGTKEWRNLNHLNINLFSISEYSSSGKIVL